MNSLAEPVLERDAPAVDPARDEHDLLVLDVDALDRADPLREVEHLGLGERLRRVEAAVALPDQRRVEALLDRRPDREGRREVVALDDEVGAVADPDLVDLVEQLVGRVAREDVGEPRLDADPDEREQARRSPSCSCAANWRSPSFTPGSVYGRSGCGSDSVAAMSRYVQPRLEGSGEDLRIEARVGRVEHGVGPRSRSRPTSALASEASTRAADEPAVVEPLDDRRRPRRGRGRRATIRVEEVAPLRDAANAAPTPPAPTTRIFMSQSARQGEQHPRRRTIADPRRARWRCAFCRPAVLQAGEGW